MSELRRLFPTSASHDLDDLYTDLTLPAPDHGWVSLCMVSSVDGAITVQGRSGGVGGPVDKLAFSRIRATNDVSLVGAGTVRTERYGPLVGTAARREARIERGLSPVPRLAIVSASGHLDPDLPVFTDPEHRPLLLVGSDADPAALARLNDLADIHTLTGTWVAATDVIETLVSLGLRRIVCEGGPHLNQALLAADRVDEVFLTLAPKLVGGAALRMSAGLDEHIRDLRLTSVHVHDDELVLRYRHPRHDA